MNQGNLILDVLDAAKVDGARAAHHAHDFIPLAEQKLCQVGTILSRNACDECSLCH